MMRTTIDLPPELHSVLTSLAASSRKSLSQTAVELMRLGLEDRTTGRAVAQPGLSLDAVTGLPVVRLSRVISPEDVRALDDET